MPTAILNVDGSIETFNITNPGTQYVGVATVAISTTPDIPNEYVTDHQINDQNQMLTVFILSKLMIESN